MDTPATQKKNAHREVRELASGRMWTRAKSLRGLHAPKGRVGAESLLLKLGGKDDERPWRQSLTAPIRNRLNAALGESGYG
jgi:hypothetical protein